jgi:hypothetical protein
MRGLIGAGVDLSEDAPVLQFRCCGRYPLSVNPEASEGLRVFCVFGGLVRVPGHDAQKNAE